MTSAKFKKLKVTALCLAMCAALSACTTSTAPSTGPEAAQQRVTTAEAFAPLDRSLSFYQNLSATSGEESRFNALILLARAQIVSGIDASPTLTELKGLALTPLQNDEIKVIEALGYAQNRNFIAAMSNLSSVNELSFQGQLASYYYQLNTRVLENLYQESGNDDYLARAFASQKSLYLTVDEGSRLQVLRATVNLLKRYPTSQLSLLQNTAQNEEDKGYYEYAIIDGTQNADLKTKLLETFKEHYPSHPLIALADANLGALQGTAQTQTREQAPLGLPSSALKVGGTLAVLLPLSGRFASHAGEPARLGLLAALNDFKPKIKVVFYDTNALSMEQIAAELKHNPANFVVGPLLKPEVDAYLKQNMKIPTILLNRASGRLPESTWYFDLTPEYEGQLAASKIFADGYRRPQVVSAQNSRSSRAAQAFAGQWRAQTGNAPTMCSYTDLNDVKTAVQKCNLDGSDSFYLSGTAMEASEIKAMISSQKGVYLTDQSYQGVNNSSLMVSLYGAKLGDMPWLLTDSELKEAMMQNIPKADAQVQRIFASGYDSLAVALNLDTLLQNTGDVLHGLSGDIRAPGSGRLESAPLWITLGQEQ